MFWQSNEVPLISSMFIFPTYFSLRRQKSFIHPPPDHLLLDRSPNIGPLISRWELDKCKNCWNRSFSTSNILTLLYQQYLNLLISQRDMSGPRLGALSNNRWSGSTIRGIFFDVSTISEVEVLCGTKTGNLINWNHRLQMWRWLISGVCSELSTSDPKCSKKWD